MIHEFFINQNQVVALKKAIMITWEQGWTGKRPTIAGETPNSVGAIIAVECNTQDFVDLMIRTGWIEQREALQLA